MANKENKGSRIAGAQAKGALAAQKGKARESNPYDRPNMREAWFVGFDSVTPADESDESAKAAE